MRRREGGFTVIEILIAVAVMVIGLAGIMAIQTAVVRGNRDSRRLDRAKMIAERDMEHWRGKSVAKIEASVGNLGDEVTAEGVTYHRTLSVSTIPGEANLVLVTVRVSYAEEGDETDLHVTTMQMLRTRDELL